MKLVLIAGVIYHLCWAIFDSFWPHLFAWKRTLSKLDDINRSLLYILSRLLVLLYLYVAFLSFFYQRELLETELGQSILIFVGSIGHFARSCRSSSLDLRALTR